MSLTMSYLTSVKNVESMFNSIIGAKAPERFTAKFLEDLGFKSSTDRLFIGILKAMGFLDEGGQPTQRYYEFLDQSQSKRIVAKGIEEAYEDLFNLNKNAQNMSNDDVKNKLKTLTQGQKSDRVIEQMAMTFRSLCSYADWSIHEGQRNDTNNIKEDINSEENTSTSINNSSKIEKPNGSKMDLHYNLQIHLPETTNMAVYDAIFQSLKRYLL